MSVAPAQCATTTALYWLTKKALDREKLLFRKQILEAVSLLLVVASLGLEMRLVTELTVYMLKSRPKELCYG